MLPLLLWVQLGGAAWADSTYSSVPLRDLVAAAAVANRQPPAELRSYRSRVETELSLILRDTLGREHTAEVEQLASEATWVPGSRYDLHVIGYRSQNIGVPYSTMSIVRGWTVPSLYGERLSLGAYFGRSGSRARDTLVAVHPFAADREKFYKFTGGDTVTVIRAGARSIPIVRVRVHPNLGSTTGLGVFDGEIDLDAQRGHIVRMRGQFMVVGRRSKREKLLRSGGVVGVAYAEFVNAEIDGKYWLPAFQRTEFQASFPLLGSARPIFRLVSSISDIAVNDSAAVVATATPRSARIRVTWAPGDSTSSYDEWRHSIGKQSGSVHADDFDDLAPDAWRPTGPPRLNILPSNASRVVRFNRVEGLFTGIAPSVDFRNLAPGLSVGGHVGWAWTERTTRGGGFVNYRVRQTTYGIRAERALATTNSFALPLTQDVGLAAILTSTDDYDYVDRRGAMTSITRTLGSLDVGLATVQFGVMRDESEIARVSHGLISSRPFRANSIATDGSYALGSIDLELHPNVTGDFVRPGVGARAHYEIGSGQLNWQRMELGLSARQYLGPISIAGHADGAAIVGSHPPRQRIVRIGGMGTLPGYEYNRFAGDYAALFRTFASYRMPLWQRPIHVFRNLFIPGLAPGIGVSAHGGWTKFSRRDTLASENPESTERIRATVGGGLTLFSDLVHFGFARPVDRPAPWRFIGGFGATF